MGECPERQRGRTVNPLAYAFVGSSPTSPTTRKLKEKVRFWPPARRPFSCRACCVLFALVSRYFRAFPKTLRSYTRHERDMKFSRRHQSEMAQTQCDCRPSPD